MVSKLKIVEDKWIPTACGGCYASCGIMVRVVNGVAVQVSGNPDSPHGQGGVCAKAIGQIQMLYKPNRVNYPMRRTTPKGVGVDPKWKRISWDEAMDEIVTRLKKIRKEDPRKLMTGGTPTVGSGMFMGAIIRNWTTAFGSPTAVAFSGGIQCGDAAHMGAGMNHCAWDIVPDWDHCNYHLCFGSNLGAGSGRLSATSMRMAAKARARGMKMVVFDPMHNFSGGKATEWVPLRCGTDGAIALAIANVLVNEVGIYDAEYLKNKTNAPYLINKEGLYARSTANEPMLWDAGENKAKEWKDTTIKDAAMAGNYEIGGVKYQPVFAAVKEHLKQYTPEWASTISTVPAETIRRIAIEFGQAASIGSTIEIKGVKFPLRPVAATMYKGGQGHQNGFHTYFSIDLLNNLMGAADVPGGCLGLPPVCNGNANPETGAIGLPVSVKAGRDGFLQAGKWIPGLPATWPHPAPKPPTKITMLDIFSICSIPPFPIIKETQDIWQKFGAPYQIEMLMIWATNPLMTGVDRDLVAKFLEKIPFIVAFNLTPSETAEGYADIILPDTSMLERLTFVEAEFQGFNYVPGMMASEWCYQLRQPVVKPTFERRDACEVFNELAHRVGFTKEWNNALNGQLGYQEFKPDEELTWEQICDRWLKRRFGPKHDLAWFKEHGILKWEKKPDEAYWRWYTNARASIYLEFMIKHEKETRELLEPKGIKVNYKMFTPFITHIPGVIDKPKDSKYDLCAFSYHDILHTTSATQGMPWLAEAGRMNPWTNFVTMNKKAAAERGIKDGDTIWIENEEGKRVSGTVRTMEGQHPMSVGICGGMGHWADDEISKGLGTHFNQLIPGDLEHCCPVTLNIETTPRVRVYLAEAKK